MKRKYKYKPDKLPRVEFWKKEYKDSFKDLTNEYIAELTQIKKLLKVFSPSVLINHFTKENLYTIRYLKKEDAKSLIFNLFTQQIEYISSLENIKKTEIENIDHKINFIEQATLASKNVISKGL